MLLRPYQNRLVERALKALKTHGNTLAIGATGSGKTLMLSDLARRVGGKQLVVQHRQELVDQNSRKFRMVNTKGKIGFFTADQKTWRGDTTFAMVQTLASEKHLAKMPKIDLLIIDECFAAGTMIDGRPIESLRVGDKVLSWSHDHEMIEGKEIIHAFKSTPSLICTVTLDDGRSFVCTAGHPFYVKGVGYVEAMRLQKGSEVLSIADVHMVRGEDRKSIENKKRPIQGIRASLLQEGMREVVQCNDFFENDGRDEQKVRIGAHDQKQPNGQGIKRQENEGDAQKYRACAEGQGRQRGWTHAPTRDLDVRDFQAEPGAGISNQDGDGERIWIPDGLQGGSGDSACDGCRRDRRGISLCQSEAVARQEKRTTPGAVRVESVEIHQQTSDGTFGGMCPGGFVYNIEVAGNNNYFANGVLVHNCHHVAAPTWKSIVSAVLEKNPKAMVAGFTATPERSDKKGLRGIFSNVCDTVTIRELVQLGFLVPPRGFVIDVQGTQSQLQAIQGTSDYFDQHEVERILNTVAINEEVVRNWMERAGDRRTVVFCSTVQHAKDVAEAFRAAGVVAECVHGGMGDDERKGIIKRFDCGQIQVITNVMVLTEGFDCLDMETEVLCPSGWKKYGEISTDDDVYGYDLSTGKIEACDVQNVGKRPLGPQERMVEIKSQHVNIRVTEGHNLFIRKNRRGDFVKIKARDMVSLKSEYEIPLAGDIEFNGVDLTDDEIRIIAWYLTDGYVTKSGRLEIYQSEKKHASRIEELITRLGYKHWSFVRKENSSGYKQNAPIVTYCIGKRQLGNIYHLLDKNLHEDLMRMDRRQFKLFWDELLLGDGSAQGNKAGWLWSNRIDAVNKLMQMAVIRGFSSSYATQEETTARKEVYRVSVREKRTIRSLPGDKRSATPRFCETTPGEEVWCVTNRLGTIITRRAGKVAVIGNCQPVSCVVLLRKCSAKGPLIQMVGRGLRTVNPEEYPGVRKADCIAEGTMILTDKGLVEISKVSKDMLLWDGVEWVKHHGVICKGEQEVIEHEGLLATPDHKVWTASGWMHFEECARKSIPIAVTGRDGKAVRSAENCFTDGSKVWRKEKKDIVSTMCRLWRNILQGLQQRHVLQRWMQDMWESKTGAEMACQTLFRSKGSVHEQKPCCVCSVRWPWDQIQFQFANGYGCLDHAKPCSRKEQADRQDRQQWSLRAWEYQACDGIAESVKYSWKKIQRIFAPLQNRLSRRQICRWYDMPLVLGWPECGANSGQVLQPSVKKAKRRVWDILNAGPRHRFTANGLLVSNCIVLDFGTSLLTHGDLEAGNALGDDVEREPGEAITKICPEKQSQSENYLVPDSNGSFGCGAELPAQTKTCPLCGFQFERPGGDDIGVTRVSLTEMDILNASPFRYVDLFSSGRAMIATGFEAWAGVFSPDGESWSALGKVKNERRIHRLADTGRVMAMAAADDFLREHETDGSAKKTKGWLDQPATSKQIELLNRFGYQAHVDLLGQSDWTKYAAACHVTFQFNRGLIEKTIGV